MSQSKQAHTPGPWIVRKYDDGAIGVRQDESAPSVSIADENNNPQEILPCGFAICVMVENDEQTEANAALIAAAPETAKERDRLRASEIRHKREFKAVTNQNQFLLSENAGLTELLQEAYNFLNQWKDKVRYKRGREYCQLMDDIEAAIAKCEEK